MKIDLMKEILMSTANDVTTNISNNRYEKNVLTNVISFTSGE